MADSETLRFGFKAESRTGTPTSGATTLLHVASGKTLQFRWDDYSDREDSWEYVILESEDPNLYLNCGWDRGRDAGYSGYSLRVFDTRGDNNCYGSRSGTFRGKDGPVTKELALTFLNVMHEQFGLTKKELQQLFAAFVPEGRLVGCGVESTLTYINELAGETTTPAT